MGPVSQAKPAPAISRRRPATVTARRPAAPAAVRKDSRGREEAVGEAWSTPATGLIPRLAAAIAGAALGLQVVLPLPVAAVLNSPNVQIPRSADAALRRSIPPFNPVAADIQKKMEEVAYLLRIPQRKPWGKMLENTAYVSKEILDRPSVLAGVKPDQQEAANAIIADMEESLQRLAVAITGRDAEK